MRRWVKAGVVAGLGTSMTLLPAASNAVGSAPGIALRSVIPEVTAVRFAEDPSLYVSAGVYAAATNGPFQLVARRTSGAVTLSYQGKVLKTPVPVDMANGVPRFFDVSVKNARGRTLTSQPVDFCPGGWFGSSRVDG